MTQKQLTRKLGRDASTGRFVVAGTTKDGVVIRKPASRGTHFTAQEAREAVARLFAEKAEKRAK